MSFTDNRPAVGVAWRKDQNAQSFVGVLKSIEAAGGRPVVLDQVLSSALPYHGKTLADGADEYGCLSLDAANLLRSNHADISDAEKVMRGIKAIVFPGGEDISPNLYLRPQNIESREGFCAERDVSDFILMSYCLDNDIPILAICRGIQVLAVVSGADMIQDIGCYIEGMGKTYYHEHRKEPDVPGGYRNFAAHDVSVTDTDSLLYRIVETDVIPSVPSWHHQAVKSVSGTSLVVTAVTDTSGVQLIEAVERPDRRFVLGIQFHPEIAVVRSRDELSLSYFRAIVKQAE